ncbi:MAG: four helix bundle protein [Cyanobacteria bacterium SIG28]|nr:four helix bundle protein [Cyanobacteria bacterium SIG28]
MHHRDLEVYKKSIDLVEQIYNLTFSFPKEETFGLTAQLRRAAISIPSNIAEGCARFSNKETANFVNIACGSLAEIETQIEIAQRLGYIEDLVDFNEKFNNLKSLLLGFKKHLIKQ